MVFIGMCVYGGQSRVRQLQHVGLAQTARRLRRRNAEWLERKVGEIVDAEIGTIRDAATKKLQADRALTASRAGQGDRSLLC